MEKGWSQDLERPWVHSPGSKKEKLLGYHNGMGMHKGKGLEGERRVQSTVENGS